MILDTSGPHVPNAAATGPQHLSTALTPDISEINKSRWETFVKDDELKSYSFYLSNDGNGGSGSESSLRSPAFTSAQLDEWFQKLHPSSYEKTEPIGHAWTDASYNGETLLRKTAWCVFDDICTCEYGYSDTWQHIIQSKRMFNVLKEITDVVSKVVGLTDEGLNNCVNLNYYPAGGGVGFHADDEFLFDGLRQETRIISLSLCSPLPGSLERDATHNIINRGNTKDWGARKFQVKRKDMKHDAEDDSIKEIILRHGDLITMEGMMQKSYLHSIWPGDSNAHQDHFHCQGERINLTWRTIVRHLDGTPECRGITCPLSKKEDGASIL